MKKLRGSTGAKIVAWVIVVVSNISFVLSACAVVVFQEVGVYRKSQAETLKSAYKNIAGEYAYRVMDHKGEQGEESNDAYFSENSNYRYGIIPLEEGEEPDLNEESAYLERNFTGEIAEADIWKNEFYETDDTVYIYGDSIWDRNYYYYDSSDDTYSYEIENLIYEASEGIFYYYANDSYYPVHRIEITVALDDGETAMLSLNYIGSTKDYHVRIAYSTGDDGEWDMYSNRTVDEEAGSDASAEIESAPLSEASEASALTDGAAASAEQNDDTIYVEEALTYDGDVVSLIQKIVARGNICLSELDDTPFGYAYWGTVTVDDWRECDFASSVELMYFSKDEAAVATDNYQLLDEGNLISDGTPKEQEGYLVVSLIPKESLVNEGNWQDGDFFVKAKILVGIAYDLKYAVIFIALASLLLFLLALIFLVQAAGHRKGTEEIVLLAVDKIPADIFAFVVVCAEGIALWILVELSYYLMDESIYVILFGLTAVAAELVAVETLLSFAVRIKRGKWWYNTILGKLCSLFGRTCGKVAENISLMWKAVLVFCGISLAEIFVIGMTGYSPGAEVFLWLIEKIVIAVLLGKTLLDLYKLKDGGEHLAAGDANYKVDTNGMLPDFRRHGENLNHIGEGITVAVDERMKSERFKTELITNVSHDIKTPLTSIINYVDLLQKEELNNETAEEYLAVLERQSARLKKLIEDLMEASKASTGNLPVNMELCEAGVFLVQTIGEFGERTDAQGLDLIIKSPEEPIYIMADGRHFWRVIDNLMNNICKYAQPGTRVYINLEARGGKVIITFRNTSKYPLNITSEELMERFVRGDSSRNTEGNGLGLNIAQNLTELMKGSFELVVDGDLFKVILTFPQAKAPAAQQTKAPVVAQEAAPTEL